MNKYLKSAVIVVALAAISIFVLVYVVNSEAVNRNTIQSAEVVKPVVIKPKVEYAPDSKAIEKIIKSNPEIDIAISVTDIEENKTYDYGENVAFTAASTTKVLIGSAYLREVEKGTKALDKKLGNHSAKIHIEKMINLSDNQSWDILKKELTPRLVQGYASSLRLKSYRFYGNKITAADQALLLSKLYKRQLLNSDNTKLLLSFMKNTNNTQMIPSSVTDGAVYNKYGFLNEYVHDSAIVVRKNRPIALAIYTKGDTSDGYYIKRMELIKSLSKTVVDSFYKTN